jgi:hypothetical protein
MVYSNYQPTLNQLIYWVSGYFIKAALNSAVPGINLPHQQFFLHGVFFILTLLA